jgi:hypothetical protein
MAKGRVATPSEIHSAVEEEAKGMASRHLMTKELTYESERSSIFNEGINEGGEGREAPREAKAVAAPAVDGLAFKPP